MSAPQSTSAAVSQGYAQLPDVRLHYAEAGQANRELVILLHGFPEFWYSWRHQLKALSPFYHVVAPDLRGFNLSDKPVGAENYRMSVLSDDVIGLINYFGAEKANVIGHDWGGAVTWSVARRYPE